MVIYSAKLTQLDAFYYYNTAITTSSVAKALKL